MLSKKVLYVLGGILLGAAGAVLIGFGSKTETTKAAVPAGTTWTTNWTASEVYQVVARSRRNSEVYNANAIGPSKWTVTGTIGTTSFTETWTGPSAAGIQIGQLTTTSGACDTNNYDRSSWVIACSEGQDLDAYYTLTTVSPSVLPVNTDINQTKGTGTYCKLPSGPVTGTGGCLLTVGSYGFFRVDTSSDPGTGRFSGLMMPLKWTVSGSVSSTPIAP